MSRRIKSVPFGVALLPLRTYVMGVVTGEWDVLVLDLDGTLLCNKGEVSEQNTHALEAVRECGIEIVIATGRSYAECKHIIEKINHTGVCITAGGSQLTNSVGKPIASEPVDLRVVEEVTEKIVQQNHRCLLLKDSEACSAQYVLVGDAPLHHASDWWFEALGISLHEVSSIEEDPWPEHTLRVGAVAEERELEPIALELEQELKGRAKLQHWSAVTESDATGSGIHLLEVFGYSVNKWAMLKRHLGVKLNRDRIAAIGDGLNDIEVLIEVGFAMVMENANNQVQQHAHVVVGHHDKNGFADAMHQWIIPRIIQL